MHAGLAAITACSEWNLDDKEAETLSKTLARVIDYYELNRIVGVATHPLAGMARVAWAIYMPKILAIKLRQAAERARPVGPSPGLARPPERPPAPPQPQAPHPQPPPAAAPMPPQGPIVSPIAPAPGHMRAAPIPGFEGVRIDVPIKPH